MKNSPRKQIEKANSYIKDNHYIYNGSIVLKYPFYSRGKPAKRYIYADRMDEKIFWRSSVSRKARYILVSHIIDINVGKNSSKTLQR